MRCVPRLSYLVRRFCWSIRRPITVGVRALLIRDGQVVLVHHTYHEAWYLVGGGVQGGETLEQAIRREAAEEVGGELGPLELFGVYSNFYEDKSDHIVVFACTEFELYGQTDREIDRFGFFDMCDLPDGVSPGTRRRVREHVEGKPTGVGLW